MLGPGGRRRLGRAGPGAARGSVRRRRDDAPPLAAAGAGRRRRAGVGPRGGPAPRLDAAAPGSVRGLVAEATAPTLWGKPAGWPSGRASGGRPDRVPGAAQARLGRTKSSSATTSPPTRPRRVRKGRRAASIAYRHPAPIAPDLDPIEPACRRKAQLHASAARTSDAPEAAPGLALATITSQDARGWSPRWLRPPRSAPS